MKTHSGVRVFNLLVGKNVFAFPEPGNVADATGRDSSCSRCVSVSGAHIDVFSAPVAVANAKYGQRPRQC